MCDWNEMAVRRCRIEELKNGILSIRFVWKVHAAFLDVNINDVWALGPFAIHVCTVHACCDTPNTKPNTAECQPPVGKQFREGDIERWLMHLRREDRKAK